MDVGRHPTSGHRTLRGTNLVAQHGDDEDCTTADESDDNVQHQLLPPHLPVLWDIFLEGA